MATMNYSTNTFTDANDLIDKFKTFAVSTAGWTSNAYADDSASTTNPKGKKLQISKSTDLFYNFRSFMPAGSGTVEAPPDASPSSSVTQPGGLFGIPSTGYSGASPWYDQAGKPFFTSSGTKYGISGIVGLVGAGTYYFWSFEDATAGYDVLYMVVEYPTDIFQHMFCGRLDKQFYGTWTGGSFFSASNLPSTVTPQLQLNFFGPSPNGFFSGSSGPRGFIYAENVDGASGDGWTWGEPQYSTSEINAMPRNLDSIRLTVSMWDDMPNSFNALNPLIPVVTGCGRSWGNTNVTATTPWSPLGELPFVYWVNLKDLNPKQNVSISTTDYKVFPFRNKGATWDQFSASNGSFNYGYAIKIN